MNIEYLANIRLPTERAHGLQIVQNCEALAAAGATVTLVVPRPTGPRPATEIDIWRHYGVAKTFALRRLPSVDLFPLMQWLTFHAALMLGLWRSRADVFYSRECLPLLAVALMRRSRVLVYEAHEVSPTRVGAWLQRRCVRRAALVIAVTDHLADELRRLGAVRVIVLRDGFRAARFARPPERADARRLANLPAAAIAVGSVGRLEAPGASTGVNDLIDALAKLADPRLHLCLVGGPLERVEALAALWIQRGLSPEAFHALGDLAPSEVPKHLAAFDICVMPLPATTHSAYRASPLKLFEYLAAGRAIVASALPSVREVVRDDETALLVPPGDIAALASAIGRLRDDPALRDRLGTAARAAAQAYTWQARAERIVKEIAGVSAPASRSSPQST